MKNTKNTVKKSGRADSSWATTDEQEICLQKQKLKGHLILYCPYVENLLIERKVRHTHTHTPSLCNLESHQVNLP